MTGATTRPTNRRRAGVLAAIVALLASALVAAPASAPAAKGNKGGKGGKERIVALTPFSANTLIKLGVKPVAIGEGQGGVKLDPKLANVPRLPLSHSANGPSLEELTSYDADTVFSERTWRAGFSAIRDLGMRIVTADPYRVSSVPRKVRTIGKVVHQKKRAGKLAKQISGQIKRASANVTRSPRVLMILGVGETPYAFLSNSWGGDLIKQAGGELLTDGLSNDGGDDLLVQGGYAQISDEQIISMNPDVIIAVPHGRADDLDAIADNLRNDPAFEVTNAAQNGDIYVTTDSSFIQGNTNVASLINQVRSDYLKNR